MTEKFRRVLTLGRAGLRPLGVCRMQVYLRGSMQGGQQSWRKPKEGKALRGNSLQVKSFDLQRQIYTPIDLTSSF